MSRSTMIDLSYRGEVAVLTMAHGKANAFDLELCEALTARLEECRDWSTNAIVITGGGSMFSAGVDLFRVVKSGADYIEAFLPAINRTFETLFTFPKPIVAAINGHAIAGGCVVACAADHRLMARGTGRIGVPELLVGVPFPTVALEIMRFAAAPRHVQALLYGGATFLPEQALTQGLVDTVVEPEALLDAAIAAAEDLAARPPAAFAMTKQQLREPALNRIRSGGQLFDHAVQDLWTAPATLEAILAYIERTFRK